MLTDINKVISTLPKTAAGIAALMAKRKITGVRGEETCCPISRYLRKRLKVPYVKVDIEEITIEDAQGNLYEVATPEAVGRFTTLFDDWEYPDLEDLDGPTDEELATIAGELDCGVQDLTKTILV